MRPGFLAGAAALLIGVGVTGANALAFNDEASAKLFATNRLQPSYGAPAAQATPQARVPDAGAGYWGALRDDPYRRPTDNGYHDPRFSLQQDDIYNGRF